MVDYGPELRRRLRDAGCFYKRQAKGDHELWHSPISKKIVPGGWHHQIQAFGQ